MDAMDAFAMGMLTRGNELMVFDWDEAAKLIKESGVKEASAGLCEDWEWTAGEIFTNGKPNMSDYTFLASTWAIPQIEIEGKRIDCYKMELEVPDWDAKTKWPESALKLLV
ncbi:MAG: hypothetical protein ABFD00_05010 [Chloroherpetonaceae bacterium]